MHKFTIQKIEIIKSNNYYYFTLVVFMQYHYIEDDILTYKDEFIQECTYNSDIAHVFNMTQGEFIRLAIKKGAKKCKLNRMLFDKEESIQQFVEYLQSLNVMEGLI